MTPQMANAHPAGAILMFHSSVISLSGFFENFA